MKNIMPSASSKSQLNKQYETAIITVSEATAKGRHQCPQTTTFEPLTFLVVLVLDFK